MYAERKEARKTCSFQKSTALPGLETDFTASETPRQVVHVVRYLWSILDFPLTSNEEYLAFLELAVHVCHKQAASQ